MSWSDRLRHDPGRRAFLGGTAAACALAGCGFSPVYGPGTAGSKLVDQVYVVQSNNSLGFSLALALQNRLGAPEDSAPYRLTTNLTTASERVAVTTAQSTNRFNLIGTVTYALTETATGNQVAAGQVDGFNSYSASGISVATRAAELDAYERLMVILADKIVSDLLVAPGLQA